MPWARSESVCNEKDADENGYRKSDKSRHGCDGEKSANCDRTTEDKQGHEDADDGVEPDRIDWCISMTIHTANPPRAGKDAISSVGKGDS